MSEGEHTTTPAGEVGPVRSEDFPRMVEVWEASVRATHHFLSEADIQFFKPLVGEAFRRAAELACVRDAGGRVAAFLGVAGENIEMLFVHPACRGSGLGRRLVEYAVGVLGAKTVDVNEQNEQAVGFYRRMGFEVVRRSPTDGLGKPFPLLHMKLRGPEAPPPDVADEG